MKSNKVLLILVLILGFLAHGTLVAGVEEAVPYVQDGDGWITGADIVKGLAYSPYQRGRIYLIDTKKLAGRGKYLHRIHIFDTFGLRKKTIGWAATRLAGLAGIAVDRYGYMYISDDSEQKVKKLRRESRDVIWAMGRRAPTIPISEDMDRSYYNRPSGLAIGERNDPYVVDTGLFRIKRLNKRNGRVLKVWYKDPGSDINQWKKPYGIAVDTARRFIYVTDRSPNRRVIKMDYSIPTGDVKRMWFQYGPRGKRKRFLEPVDVEVDSNGNFFVADLRNNDVVMFNSNGNYVYHWRVMKPTGLAVDKDGNVYVASGYAQDNQKRIYKFKKTQ